MTEQLDLLSHLIRPEVGNDAGRRHLARRPIVRELHRVLDGVLPVLDANELVALDARQGKPCHVTDRRDVWRRLKVTIDDDAFVDRKT